MMNIGIRPTISDNEKPRHSKIEINLFDFNKSIYDEVLEVSLIARIRDEIKFDNIDALKEQLTKDRNESIKILNS